MHALLTHPAVQAALAPFLLALLTAELLQRLRLSGLAIIAGFAITVYLVSGFAYTPLSGTRKIIWLGLASGVIGLGLSMINWTIWRPLLTVLGASAAVWVALPVLMQQALPVALQCGAGYALFAGWIIFWMDKLEDSPVRAASAGIALALGTGVTLLLAGAALLGKFDLAVGSAAFAYLFIMFVSNSHLPYGRSFTLPLAVISALSACLAVLTTKLPWYTLAIFAAIPPLGRLPVADNSPVWVQSTLLTCATLFCAMAAVYTSWHIYGWTAF